MAERDDAGPQVDGKGADDIVRHADDALHVGDRPGLHVLGSRIADRHLEAVEQRHGRQVFGQRAGADQ